jgi:hypothetical protein
MPRPPSTRVEEAFHTWSTEGARNAARTARILGVPPSTVRYWQRTYGWRERDRSAQEADTEAASRAALHAVRRATPDVARKLLWLATGEKPLRNRQGQIVFQDGEPVMVPAASNRDALRAAQIILSSGLLDRSRASNRSEDVERPAAASRSKRRDHLGPPFASLRFPTPPGMGRRRR